MAEIEDHDSFEDNFRSKTSLIMLPRDEVITSNQKYTPLRYAKFSRQRKTLIPLVFHLSILFIYTISVWLFLSRKFSCETCLHSPEICMVSERLHSLN